MKSVISNYMNVAAKKYHLQLLREIKKNAGKETKEQKEWLKKYMGTKKAYYSVKSETKNRLIKNWIKKHRDISLREYESLLNLLYKGKSHEEFGFASRLLEYLPKLREQINIDSLDEWLDNAEGWGEVDSICQSNFSSKELLANWEKWKKMILKFSKDSNIHKRRASLVLLTKPVRESADKRFSGLGFTVINKLKKEKEILITKAISWLLRDLIKNNRILVENYLKDNNDLPRIATRETKNKLLTGKK